MSALDRRSALEIVRRVLAADYSCDKECFGREGVQVFHREERAGRRRFHRNSDRPSLALVTFGVGAVVTCSSDRLEWAERNLRGRQRDELFSARILATIDELVGWDDQFVYGPNLLHVCSADTLREVSSPDSVDLSVVEPDTISELYAVGSFPNALGRQPNVDRPNVLATVARRSGQVIGVAGGSADSDDLWQIGVDVLPDYRGRGIGTALVHRVTEAILNRGKVPYYATVSANLASRNVANAVGFWPAWIEAGSYEGSRLGPP